MIGKGIKEHDLLLTFDRCFKIYLVSLYAFCLVPLYPDLPVPVIRLPSRN